MFLLKKRDGMVKYTPLFMLISISLHIFALVKKYNYEDCRPFQE